MTETQSERMGPERTLAFTDAVIAIAMTLLALDLKPDAPHDASSRQLATYLGNHAGQYVAFALAFVLIARYWLTHHRLMSTVTRTSGPLLQATLLFLFAITLMPLATYLTGTYSNPLAHSIFAGTIALASVGIIASGEAIHRGGLDDRVESPEDKATRRWRSGFSLFVPLLVAGLSWVLGGNAAYFYLLLLGTDYSARLATRWSRRT